jgi:hypothetical protein
VRAWNKPHARCSLTRCLLRFGALQSRTPRGAHGTHGRGWHHTRPCYHTANAQGRFLILVVINPTHTTSPL